MNKLILTSIVLTLAIALGSMALLSSTAQAIRYGEVRGTVTGSVNGSISATLTMKDNTNLQFFIQAFNGDLNNSRILVTGNTANAPATSILLDNFTAGTNGTFGHYYDANHLASKVPINPATLPYISIQTSKGDTGATQKLTYQALR